MAGTKRKLSTADRDLIRQISQAAFSNPFSDERLEIERNFVGASSALSRQTLLERMTEELARRVQRLEKEGKADVRQLEGPERKAFELTLAFHVYHCFLEDLNTLIEEQMKRGAEPVPVPFAEDLLDCLKRYGFAADYARRILAFFYQFRRAYYFIDQRLIGCCESMREFRLHLWNNVFTHDIVWYEQYLWDRMEGFSTLILGETGTGKGTAAAAIGRSGFIPFDHRKGVFKESFTETITALNLSLYPETLIESELFGHRKGAFTGAIEDHAGIFSRCGEYGTIFLDEIGDVTTSIQIKLLHVLEERTYRPVGSHTAERFYGRIIAATNRPIQELREEGRFRDDLYYRLCSDVIHVPPLQQRIQEDPRELDDLLRHTVQRLTGADSPPLVAMLHENLQRDLGSNYRWPGNVRELEQAVRRIILRGAYEGDQRAVGSGLRDQLREGISQGTLEATRLLSMYCKLLYERYGTYEEVARRARAGSQDGEETCEWPFVI